LLHLLRALAVLVMIPGAVGLLAGLLVLAIGASLGGSAAGFPHRPLHAVATSSAALASGLVLFALATVLHQARIVRRALASDLGSGATRRPDPG